MATYTIIDVQQITGAGAAVTSVQTPAFAANPVTGDLILVAVASWQIGGGLTHNAPTDTAGNTYAQIGTTVSILGGNDQISLWGCVNATGGSTFRVTSTTASAYRAAVAWCVRPSAAIVGSGDVASFAVVTNVGNNDPVTSPAPPSSAFFLTIANRPLAPDNSLTEGTGWNTTGVHGFTSGLQTAAKYGLQTVNVSLYTAYKISATAEMGEWVDTADNSRDRAVIVASWAPAAIGAITGTGAITIGAPALSGTSTSEGTATITIGAPALSGLGPADPIVTQIPVEVVAQSDLVTVTTTQAAVEVVAQTDSLTVVVTQAAVETIYAFSGVCGSPALGGATYLQRRLRQWMLPSDPDGRWIFLRRLELVLQAGVGVTTGTGSDPHVLLSLSHDGGKTWGPERRLAAGKRGQYEARVWLQNAGRYRDGAVRIVVSDPVVWSLLAAEAVLEVGTS